MGQSSTSIQGVSMCCVTRVHSIYTHHGNDQELLLTILKIWTQDKTLLSSDYSIFVRQVRSSSVFLLHTGETDGGANSQTFHLTATHPGGPVKVARDQLCHTNTGYWHVGGQGAARSLKDPLPHPGWQHSWGQCPCKGMWKALISW